MASLLSPQQALIYVMVTASAADRRMIDQEIQAIGMLVQRLPVFHGYEPARISGDAAVCADLLQADEGLDAILGMVREALPHELAETAYALAVEIAAVDGRLPQEELIFLQMLEDGLEVDKLAVAAIERSARVRYRALPAS